MAFVKEWKAVDAKTFTADAEGALRPGAAGAGQAVVERALHDAQAHRRDRARTSRSRNTIGSGPFIFKADEWKPGDKAVYVKIAKYKPRAEPPSGLAGGKVAKVDRVEWRAIPDAQTAVNALIAGEIDMIEDAAARPAAGAGEGHERQARSTRTRWATSTSCASTRCTSPSTTRRSARPRFMRLQPEGLPEGGASATRSTTRSARRCSSAARRSPPTRAWTTCSKSNFEKSQASC